MTESKSAGAELRAPSRATRSERYAAGKRIRQKVPRSIHSRWVAGPDRPDPITLLKERDRDRDPKLLPIRYARMAASPFGFLRGADAIMARDLSTTPVSGLTVQLCGDAHISNFGVFGTPEREQVFDLNDFDETLAGPWEWDVKRLATSLVVAGRQNRFGSGAIRRAARRALQTYRERMEEFARMRYLDVWYSHIDLQGAGLPRGRALRKILRRARAKALTRTSLHAFPKITEVVRGRYRIRDEPPLIVHYQESISERIARDLFARYVGTLPEERRMLLERYHVEDVAQKVIGVGSVGLRCSVVLLLGDRDLEDPLFLQLKEATSSSLEPYLEPSPYANHAERVVVGQHMIQEASDVFLGWGKFTDRDLYVRQLRDLSYSYEISTLGAREFAGQAELCGATLARAHARTGDPVAISGYIGNRPALDEAILRFAEAYADQTEKDRKALLAAIRSGRLPAATRG